MPYHKKSSPKKSSKKSARTVGSAVGGALGGIMGGAAARAGRAAKNRPFRGNPMTRAGARSQGRDINKEQARLRRENAAMRQRRG